MVIMSSRLSSCFIYLWIYHITVFLNLVKNAILYLAGSYLYILRDAHYLEIFNHGLLNQHIMECVIAVHAGAGYQKTTKEANYKKICIKACKKGLEVLKNNGSALEAVTVATMVLEDSPLTNAGYGSNLTWNGSVECDASIMDGSNMNYGGVGAVSGIKNPITLAKLICEKQSCKMSFGRIPPCLLVGQGAHEFATANNIIAVDPFNLISERAKKDFVQYKYKVINQKCSNSQPEKSRFDTVGCVGMDKFGTVAASSSSGGILLKQNGRVGQAALLGSGCWAQISDDVAMAITTSGCGEYLIKTNLAREMSKQLLNSSCPTIAINKCFNEDFIHSPLLRDCNEKFAGALVLYKNKDCCEILTAHTTKSMCIAYATEHDKKVYNNEILLEYWKYDICVTNGGGHHSLVHAICILYIEHFYIIPKFDKYSSFVSRLTTNALQGRSVIVQGYPI